MWLQVPPWHAFCFSSSISLIFQYLFYLHWARKFDTAHSSIHVLNSDHFSCHKEVADQVNHSKLCSLGRAYLTKGFPATFDYGYDAAHHSSWLFPWKMTPDHYLWDLVPLSACLTGDPINSLMRVEMGPLGFLAAYFVPRKTILISCN